MSFLRTCSQRNGVSLLLGLPTLALASLLNTAPSLAAQSSSQTVVAESDSVMVDNIFRQIGEAVRGITETVNTVDSLLQQVTGSGNGNNPAPQPQSTPPSAAPSASPNSAAMPTDAGRTASSTPSSSQILHRDTSPTRCNMVGDESSGSDLNCEQFQLGQVDNLLVFSYYFRGTPISFLALAEPMQQTETATGYLIGKMMIDDAGLEVVGSCVIGRIGNIQYGAIQCTTEGGMEFLYLN